MRPKHNFAYITGTNRQDDIPIIRSLIKQARAVGVVEDIHVFAPLPVSDCVYHQFSGDWRNHMAKLDFARSFADSIYDAVIWLDSDTWFVRDPGNVAETLLRGNKCWTSSEGEITAGSVRFGDWWSIPIANGRLSEVFTSYGCGPRQWNTNGGMWIIRRDAIEEFTTKCEKIFNELRPTHPTMSDEPPLAITCQSMIPDPELNTIEHTSNVWACDWRGVFTNSAPTGQPWEYEDWLTGQKTAVNPAIGHLMRLKNHMRAIAGHSGEPVGTKLAEIISECGISRPEGCSCKTLEGQMNAWGISGCQAHRKEILTHLAEASDGQWLDMARAVAKGYFSVGSMLNEAMKRAAA